MKEQVLENMNEFSVFIGLLIPLLGTMLGSAFVFFMKDEMSARVQKSLLGFASGVMVAASVWSLLIPAMEMEADSGKWSVVPAAIGFLLGIGFLLDRIPAGTRRTDPTPSCWFRYTRRPPFQTVANSHAGTGCHHS